MFITVFSCDPLVSLLFAKTPALVINTRLGGRAQTWRSWVPSVFHARRAAQSPLPRRGTQRYCYWTQRTVMSVSYTVPPRTLVFTYTEKDEIHNAMRTILACVN